MKTKQILVAGLLLMGAMQLRAQTSSTTETGYGLENGATQNPTGSSTGGTFFGYQAGKLTANSSNGASNTFLGHQSGSNNAAGNNNTFTGYVSGAFNTSGQANVFSGSFAGYSNTTGSYNIFTGMFAGQNNTTGSSNVYIGHGAGLSNVNAYANVFVGHQTGLNATGTGNVLLGPGAGTNIAGDNNVMIGNNAGFNATGSNKLYIANSTTTTPMIYGDFTTSKVGIGGLNSFPTTSGSVNVTNYRLFVKGGILTEEVRVHLQTGWADYVFADTYNLKPLSEVEQYIATNGHLPNVPSAKQVEEDGIEVGQMAKIQQEKIEELTLYAIQQNKQLDAQKQQLEQQQKEIDELKAAVKALTQKQ